MIVPFNYIEIGRGTILSAGLGISNKKINLYMKLKKNEDEIFLNNKVLLNIKIDKFSRIQINGKITINKKNFNRILFFFNKRIADFRKNSAHISEKIKFMIEFYFKNVNHNFESLKKEMRKQLNFEIIYDKILYILFESLIVKEILHYQPYDYL